MKRQPHPSHTTQTKRHLDSKIQAREQQEGVEGGGETKEPHKKKHAREERRAVSSIHLNQQTHVDPPPRHEADDGEGQVQDPPHRGHAELEGLVHDVLQTSAWLCNTRKAAGGKIKRGC